MTTTEIRPTTPADMDALAAVLVHVHATDGYPVEGVGNPRKQLELSDPIGQWTALLEGQPVGHVAVLRPQAGDGAPSILTERDGTLEHQIAVLAKLFIAPEARSRGLADGLMEVAEEQAHKLELSLVLDVMLKDRAAVSLYLRRRWTAIGHFVHPFKDCELEPALAMAFAPGKRPASKGLIGAVRGEERSRVAGREGGSESQSLRIGTSSPSIDATAVVSSSSHGGWIL